MRATGPDCEYLRSVAHQENLLVTDMADELAAIRKLGERYALPQIGAAGYGLVLSHSLLPLAISDRVRLPADNCSSFTPAMSPF